MNFNDYMFPLAVVIVSVSSVLLVVLSDSEVTTSGAALVFEDHTKDARVERQSIEGHDYLMITRPEDNAFTAVHDPDCPCSHKTAELESNEKPNK